MAAVFLFVYFFVKNVTPVAQHNFSRAKGKMTHGLVGRMLVLGFKSRFCHY